MPEKATKLVFLSSATVRSNITLNNGLIIPAGTVVVARDEFSWEDMKPADEARGLRNLSFCFFPKPKLICNVSFHLPGPLQQQRNCRRRPWTLFDKAGKIGFLYHRFLKQAQAPQKRGPRLYDQPDQHSKRVLQKIPKDALVQLLERGGFPFGCYRKPKQDTNEAEAWELCGRLGDEIDQAAW